MSIIPFVLVVLILLVGSMSAGIWRLVVRCLSVLKKYCVLCSPFSCHCTPALNAIPFKFSRVKKSIISSHTASASLASFLSSTVDVARSAVALCCLRCASYSSIVAVFLALASILAVTQNCLIFFFTLSHCSCLLRPRKQVRNWKAHLSSARSNLEQKSLLSRRDL